MLVIRNKTFSYIQKFGSQRNVSVVRPKGKRPDLAFKTPTCIYREKSFVLHGKAGFLSSSRETII